MLSRCSTQPIVRAGTLFINPKTDPTQMYHLGMNFGTTVVGVPVPPTDVASTGQWCQGAECSHKNGNKHVNSTELPMPAKAFLIVLTSILFLLCLQMLLDLFLLQKKA